MEDGLISKAGLNESDLTRLKELVATCSSHDGFEIKLNWEMLTSRNNAQVSDFCYYRESKLVGYLSLDNFGQSCEMTGLVLPRYRRQGIFRQLLAEARQEAFRRKAHPLLLVAYQFFPASKAVATAAGGSYDFSEYHLAARIEDLPAQWAESELTLQEVKLEEVELLSQMLSLSFPSDSADLNDDTAKASNSSKLQEAISREGRRYFFARLGQQTIGQIGVMDEAGGSYIRAVGIMPTYRGKGYGRQLLETTLQLLVKEGYKHFELDVVTQNRNALSLYLSCGFKEVNVYDYYRLMPI